MLKPLGDRVLIRPAERPTQTESGLHLVEHAKPEQVGTVVAVGTPVHPLKAEAEVFACELEQRPLGLTIDTDVASLLRTLTAREPSVREGDLVLFSWNVGQELYLHETDERLLLMREDDILAVIEG